MTPDPMFPMLFSPLQLGPITLKNRIVNSAHQTGFAHAGRYTDALFGYHRERMRGGAGMVVSQATSLASPRYLDLWNDNDEIIEEYRVLSEIARAEGSHYVAELSHPGRHSDYADKGAPVYFSPSPVGLKHVGVDWRVPHELSDDDIWSIIDAFAAAARRCREGGLSGIELHFGHGNLAEQFISPLTNRRTDEWGGSFERRLRFPLEVLQAVRSAVGSEMAVGCRITGSGYGPDKRSATDMIEVAGTLSLTEALDYVSVTMGHYSDLQGASINVPNMSYPAGLWQRQGKAMREALDLPVLLVGRINHPAIAEELLESGSCDGVVMARGLIADPWFPTKAAQGRTEDIRPCIGAMNCLHHLSRGEGIKCVHNPVVGRETEWGGDLPAAARARRVLVVGGGPAGLETARVASARGHQVTLVERGREVGGQVALAARAPGRDELAQIVEWLQIQCQANGVEIRTSVDADADLIAAHRPDLLVLATGSSLPSSPDEEATPRILDPAQVVRSTIDPPVRKVVVFDEFGDWQGFNVAHSLAARGAEVHFVCSTMFPGSALEMLNWYSEYGSLVDLGVSFYPFSTVALDGDVAVVTSMTAGASVQRIADLDAYVDVRLPVAETSLASELSGGDLEMRVIGDAFAPRGIEEAIYEGHRLGREI